MPLIRNFTGLGLFVALLMLALSGCNNLTGNAEDGGRWYKMHNCLACHGPQGDDGKAPKIKNIDIGFRTFKSIVRDAGSPIMPKYTEEKVSNQDVADIYAWLKS